MRQPEHMTDGKPSTGQSGRIAAQAALWLFSIALTAAAVRDAHRRLISDDLLRAAVFHPDEAWATGLSYFYDLFFLERDLHDWRWFQDYIGPDHPHWGHYLTGWSMARDGITRPSNDVYLFNLSEEENRAAGRYPPPDALLAGRRVMAAMGVLSVALLAGIGFTAGRPLSGALAAWLISHNALFIQSVTRAMMEGPLMAGCSASVICAMLAWRCLRRPSRFAASIGLLFMIAAGLAAGFAMGVKLNGLLAMFYGMAVALLLLIQRTLRWPQRFTRAACAYVLVAAATLMFFHYTNPYLSSFPEGEPEAKHGFVGGLRNMFSWRASLLKTQERQQPQKVIQGGLAGRTKIVLRKTLGRDGQHSDSEYSFATLDQLWRLPLDAVLAALGALSMIFSAVRRRTPISPPLLLLLWVALSLAATILTVPLDWERYYLPALFPLQLLVAAGAAGWVELKIVDSVHSS